MSADLAPDEYPVTRLAAVQAASVFLDREASVRKAVRLIDEAGRAGAQLIGFPEGFVPGHPLWYRHFRAGSAPDRRLSRRLFENAVEVPSPATDALGDAAQRAGAYVAIGICERAKGSMGTMYNSLLFLGPDGQVLGCHRKLVPTGTERLVHAAGDGSSLRTHPTPFGPIGGLICGEHTNSFARMALLLQGERFHVASWPSFVGPSGGAGSEGIDIRVRMHAFEGRIFVISATAVLDDDTARQMGLDEQQISELGGRGGHSGILNPQGRYIAGPAATDVETILYADADQGEIIDGRLRQDVTGHYNRFDVFTLEIHAPGGEPLRFGRRHEASAPD